ncbi:MAG: hypothetical protein AAAB36_27195, partial [Ensifer adhaerens]
SDQSRHACRLSLENSHKAKRVVGPGFPTPMILLLTNSIGFVKRVLVNSTRQRRSARTSFPYSSQKTLISVDYSQNANRSATAHYKARPERKRLPDIILRTAEDP